MSRATRVDDRRGVVDERPEQDARSPLEGREAGADVCRRARLEEAQKLILKKYAATFRRLAE